MPSDPDRVDPEEREVAGLPDQHLREDRYLLALRASSEGIWDWEIAEGDIYYSDQALKLLGYTAEAAPNIIADAREHLHPDDADSVATRLDAYLKTGSAAEPFAAECRFRTASGEHLWFRLRAVAVWDYGSRPVRLVGTLANITPRKVAEEALLEERHLLRQLIDTIPINIYFKDIASRFTLANRALARWFGRRDPEDRWAGSRPIWNQHAYSVTHVSDTGRVTRRSDWRANHAVPELNNFRMNAQGDLGRTGAADLTVALARAGDLCDVSTPEVTLAANVCNRGTNPVPDGARVVFFDGDPDAGAPIACETSLPTLLEVGACAELSCLWTTPEGTEELRDIVVVVDPDNEVFECRDGNNRGVIPDVYCNLI